MASGTSAAAERRGSRRRWRSSSRRPAGSPGRHGSLTRCSRPTSRLQPKVPPPPSPLQLTRTHCMRTPYSRTYCAIGVAPIVCAVLCAEPRSFPAAVKMSPRSAGLRTAGRERGRAAGRRRRDALLHASLRSPPLLQRAPCQLDPAAARECGDLWQQVRAARPAARPGASSRARRLTRHTAAASRSTGCGCWTRVPGARAACRAWPPVTFAVRPCSRPSRTRAPSRFAPNHSAAALRATPAGWPRTRRLRRSGWGGRT